MHARVLRPSNVRVGQKLQKHPPWSQPMKGRTIQSWSTFQVQLKPRDGFTSLVVLWCVCCLVNLWSPYSFQVFMLERGSCASWHHLDAPWIHCLHMCLQAIYNFPDWIYFCTHTHICLFWKTDPSSLVSSELSLILYSQTDFYRWPQPSTGHPQAILGSKCGPNWEL